MERTHACARQSVGSRALFRFTLIDAENAESLGVVAFARQDWKKGDLIFHGPGRTLRVVQVWLAERDDELPVLVVELAN